MEPANDKRAVRQREGSRTAEVKILRNFSVLNQIAAMEIRGKPRKSDVSILVDLRTDQQDL